MSWLHDEDVRHYLKLIGGVMISCLLILGGLMIILRPGGKIELKAKIVEYGENVTSIDLIQKVKGQDIEEAIKSKGSLTFGELEITADELDTSRLGKQSIRYSFSDGSEDVVEEIEVKDSVNPVIKVKNEEIELSLSDFLNTKTWKKYYEVTDNYFEAPTSTERLDKTKADYGDILHLEITAIDVSGNKSAAKLTIKIKEEEKHKDKKEESRVNNAATVPPQNQDNKKDDSPIKPNEHLPKAENKLKPAGKEYLFSDGWDMSSAPNQCQIDLQNSGVSGSCIPIQDDKGIYLGMKLIFN